jgi:hypothetical protein
MAAEWAFARHYPNELTRRSALPAWLHSYNHHRHFLGLTDFPGHYSHNRDGRCSFGFKPRRSTLC